MQEGCAIAWGNLTDKMTGYRYLFHNSGFGVLWAGYPAHNTPFPFF